MTTIVRKNTTKNQKIEQKMSEKNELSPRIPRKIHAGRRLRELVEKGERGIVNKLAKHLNVNRGAIHARYDREDFGHNEIVLICEVFGISYEEFVGIDLGTEILNRVSDEIGVAEDQARYKSKKYVEDRLDELERLTAEIAHQVHAHHKAIKRLTDNQIDDAERG